MTHPVLVAAAGGELPAWAEATEARRSHMARVADLLEEWAMALGESSGEVVRWRATGMLHDALRDGDPDSLRPWVSPLLGNLPAPVLHAPAAAGRLAAEGVDDEELLEAVAFHPLGHPRFGRLGRLLYIADAIEPGRRHDPPRGAALRARMPRYMDAVLVEVAADRLSHAIRERLPLHEASIRFWNEIAGAGDVSREPAHG